MPNYRRIWHEGGCHFLTLVLTNRHTTSLLIDRIDALRNAVRKTKGHYPFHIHAWVVLPDDMHCNLELPPGDDDCALRVRLIKSHFSRAIDVGEARSPQRRRSGERGIWQQRYWARLLVDETDYSVHMDYVHFNPVKHGLVEQVRDWPYSTFHRLVDDGVYPLEWGGSGGMESVI